MGFEFGVISDLDCEIATMAFVLSIGFLIIFEFLTGDNMHHNADLSLLSSRLCGVYF